MKRNWSYVVGAVALLFAAACSDDRTTGPAGQEAFARYVSIGTSVSMGVQSDGVYYATQQHAWPAILAHMAFASSFTEPLIAGPGCYSPLIAPLQFQRRLSGAQYPAISSSTNPPGDQVCALLGGVTLPTNNVAIDGATTYAALRVTPETTAVAPTSVESDQRKRLYKAVLLPKNSQVTEMMAQNPTLVSVELGANEVLRSVTGGILVPAAAYRQPDNTFTFYPMALWQPQYDAIVDSVAKTGAKALLVSVPLIPSLVGVYPGDDFYQQAAAFQSFGVIINPDCQGNTNLIYAFGKVFTALGSPKPYNFSCTNNPAAADFILTPADTAFIDNLIRQMNDHISTQASSHGWAYLDLNSALASFVAQKSHFSLPAFLGCTRPFGQYISLDGIHPSADGQQEVANAAADALNSKYGFAIPKNSPAVLTPAQLCP
ncbi:MAG TPA: SGNH/GDSL hydrolase family protein [Gemmatimonadaceae bacterium]|jgi:lysophospholipase L1-like esterase|nr:SGNH/GDSL hydrolase family protein [Gemmatimonadaceae bacterium]